VIAAPPAVLVYQGEQKLLDHASFERQVPTSAEREAAYQRAYRAAAALHFVFFLENLETLRWADIAGDVARYNRG